MVFVAVNREKRMFFFLMKITKKDIFVSKVQVLFRNNLEKSKKVQKLRIAFVF